MSVRWADVFDETLAFSVRSLDTMDTIRIEVNSGNTVTSVKQELSNVLGIAPVYQKLMFERVVLHDDHSLSEYSLSMGCLLHVADTRETKIPVVVGWGNIVLVRAVPSLRVRVFKARVKSAIGLSQTAGCFLFAKTKLNDRCNLDSYQLKLPILFVLKPLLRPKRAILNGCI